MVYRLRNSQIRPVNSELHAWPHRRLGKAIGSVGILLPLSLVGGNLASHGPLLPGSISGYYYTGMRDFFVGGLCMLGVGLLACRGSDKVDGILVSAAGSCVISTACCPTKPLLGGHRQLTEPQNIIGDLHDAFAITAFIALGLIALRFARTRNSGAVVLHRFCAAMVFGCVLLAPVASHLSAPVDVTWPPLLISEVLAMWAAGVSWIAAGRTGAATQDPVRTSAGRRPARTRYTKIRQPALIGSFVMTDGAGRCSDCPDLLREGGYPHKSSRYTLACRCGGGVLYHASLAWDQARRQGVPDE